MKICSYTMMTDKGFAPNPFHGYCTLAACTPNHMNAQLEQGDWLAGFFTNSAVPQMVYCMRVDEVMNYDLYFSDPRFQKKKPKMTGSWRERCGDNIYHHDVPGHWLRERNPHHHCQRSFEQDTRNAIVYIGTTFAYFGSKSASACLPSTLREVLKKGEGIKYSREGDLLFRRYLRWLQLTPWGLHGDPRDKERVTSCSSLQEQNACRKGRRTREGEPEACT